MRKIVNRMMGDIRNIRREGRGGGVPTGTPPTPPTPPSSETFYILDGNGNRVLDGNGNALIWRQP